MILPARSATIGTQRHPEHRFTEQEALLAQVSTSTDGCLCCGPKATLLAVPVQMWSCKVW
jgi:hypothetical protein